MSTPERIHLDTVSEVWIGDCLDPEHVAAIMGDRRANALIVDAPYSEKTHAGHDGASRRDIAGTPDPGKIPQAIAFARWSPEQAIAFARLWPSVGWHVTITDHILAPHWAAAWEEADLYVFAPLPLVETGSRIRLTGDGPSTWVCWIVVARPKTREMASWGTLPGAYVQTAEARGTDRIVGGKPLAAMLGIVRDYSRPGDLVVDPCCGAGTTGIAARMLGRRFIGVDKDPKHATIAARRIANAREQTRMPWAEASGDQPARLP